jgi:hypothetical protein
MLAEHRFELKNVSGVINLADGWLFVEPLRARCAARPWKFPGEK